MCLNSMVMPPLQQGLRRTGISRGDGAYLALLGMHDVVRPVRRRLILARDGAESSIDTVFCETRGISVDASTCKACACTCKPWSLRAVVCAEAAPPSARWSGRSGGCRGSPRVTLVRADVPSSAIRGLSDVPAHPLPVLDGEWFLGVATRRRLQVPRWPWAREVIARAADLAVGASLRVPETEPIGLAMRLMARRGARVLALVDPVGVVQGVLFDLDGLRLLARR